MPPRASRAPPTIGVDGGADAMSATGASASDSVPAGTHVLGKRETVVSEVGGGLRMFRLLLPSATAELAPGTKLADPKHWASGGGRGALVPPDWTTVDSSGSG